MPRKVICKYAEECISLCEHRKNHEEIDDCSNVQISCDLKDGRSVDDVVCKFVVNKKWEEKELVYLKKLKEFEIEGNKILTWKQISKIINDKFDNNRSSNACQVQYSICYT